MSGADQVGVFRRMIVEVEWYRTQFLHILTDALPEETHYGVCFRWVRWLGPLRKLICTLPFLLQRCGLAALFARMLPRAC